MTDDLMTVEEAIERLASDQVPSDSRPARQMARRKLIVETVMAQAMGRLEEFDVVMVDYGTPAQELGRMKPRGINLIVLTVPFVRGGVG